MAFICYPFHVKHAGRDYAPGEPIQVSDPAPYTAKGARVAPDPEPENTKPARKRAAKPRETAQQCRQ